MQDQNQQPDPNQQQPDPNQQQQQQPAPPGPPGPPQPAVPFQLVPGSGAAIIDYNTKEGISLYNSFTRSLYEDPADLFNVEAAGLQTFLALLQHRGNTSGWDFDIPQDNANIHANLMSLLSNHGRFTMDHLDTYSQAFIFQQSRAAQDNMMIVKCIIASLSLPGFRKIQVWHDSWHINGLPAYPLLIKVIIRESYIDTQATTRILREHLSSLPVKLDELKGDIDQLNAFVKVTEDQLLARNETTNDLLANLFKGYLSSRDITFRRYIEKKQEDYDDGTPFTVDSLMNLASNKFKTLVEAGKWMAPTDEQAKIIALETKISQMNKKGSSNSPIKPPTKGNTVATSSKGGKGGKKPIPSWMTKWPGKDFVDANKTKVVEGRTYWWCKKHKRFCMHQTSQCRKPSYNNQRSNPQSNGPTPVPATTQSNNSSSTPSIRVSTATLMDE